MLELIAMVAGIVICVLVPIEVGKIRRGWVRPKFAGDRAKFLAAYRKQLRYLMWLGIVFGVLGTGLALVETTPGESIVKLVGAVIWFAVAVVSFTSLRTLATVPETGPSGISGA
jgi:predicted Na+-dependent transporter